jgi:glucosylceramidase
MQNPTVKSTLRKLTFLVMIVPVLSVSSPADDANAPSPIPHLTRYLTARDLSARLQAVPIDAHLSSTNPRDLASVRVEPRVRYQEIVGFGGAFTDAAGYVLQKMPAAKQEEILRAYFDPVQGIGYTLCRTHINSCDFSLENYAYDETPGDVDLKNFSIERDRKYLIPMIKRAQKISNNGFKLFASPWSPPAWMKTNGEMNNGGKLKPEDREAWARYFVRYIQEYGKEGIPIWGVTVQNEPAAKQPWDSCVYSGEEERDFVRDHLGPTFAKAGLDTHIIIWDHNRDIMYERAKAVLDDPEAAKYVWGVGFHWYVADLFDNVQRVHDAWPDKHLLLTEGCQEGGPHLGEWAMGERYGRSLIQDLNHWSVGWVDWNMILDQTGGPNHVGNLCSAPIIAHTDTGEVSYESSYYYLGQFAKFIRPGAVRVLAAPTSDSLETTAFVNPDGSTVVVVMNRTELPVRFELHLGTQAAQMDAPQHSIQTIVVNP